VWKSSESAPVAVEESGPWFPAEFSRSFSKDNDALKQKCLV
jgi:hypothetical protein